MSRSCGALLTRESDIADYLFGFLSLDVLLNKVYRLSRSSRHGVQVYLSRSLEVLKISYESLLSLCENRHPHATQRMVASLFHQGQHRLRRLEVELCPYSCHRWNLLMLLTALRRCTCGSAPEKHAFESSLEELVITAPCSLSSVDAMQLLEHSRDFYPKQPAALETDAAANFFTCARDQEDYRCVLESARLYAGPAGTQRRKRRRQLRSMPELVRRPIASSCDSNLSPLTDPTEEEEVDSEEGVGPLASSRSSGSALKSQGFWVGCLSARNVWIEKVDWSLIFQWFPRLRVLDLELGMTVAHSCVPTICFQLPLDMQLLRPAAVSPPSPSCGLHGSFRRCLSSVRSVTLRHSTPATLSLGGEYVMAFDNLEHLALGFDEIEIFNLDLRSLLVAQLSPEDSSTAVCKSLRSLSLTTHVRDMDAQAAVVLLLLRSFETTPQLTPSVTSFVFTDTSSPNMGQSPFVCSVACPSWLSHDCRYWRFPSLTELQIPALRLASPEVLPLACPGLAVLRCLHASPSVVTAAGEFNEATSDVLRLKLLLERCPRLSRVEIWLSCDVRSLTTGLEALAVWHARDAVSHCPVQGDTNFESVALVARPANHSPPPSTQSSTQSFRDIRVHDYLVSAPQIIYRGCERGDGCAVLFTCAAGWKPTFDTPHTFFLMT